MFFNSRLYVECRCPVCTTQPIQTKEVSNETSLKKQDGPKDRISLLRSADNPISSRIDPAAHEHRILGANHPESFLKMGRMVRLFAHSHDSSGMCDHLARPLEGRADKALIQDTGSNTSGIAHRNGPFFIYLKPTLPSKLHT